MKIFIDSAKIEEIESLYSARVVDGVTTNPSLMKVAIESMNDKKLNLDKYIKQILKLAKGTPVSLEVTSDNFKGMVTQGKTIFKKYNPVAKNVYVKIPVNPAYGDSENIFDGIKAIKTLSKLKIPVNCTLIFTPLQALMAAKAGAKFVSPFEGREEDYIRKKFGIKFRKEDYYPIEGMSKGNKKLNDKGIVSGFDLIYQIKTLFIMQGVEAEILAASIRNVQQMREAGLAGADIVTVPYNTLKDSLSHDKTAEGMKKFTDDIDPDYEKLIGGKK